MFSDGYSSRIFEKFQDINMEMNFRSFVRTHLRDGIAHVYRCLPDIIQTWRFISSISADVVIEFMILIRGAAGEIPSILKKM